MDRHTKTSEFALQASANSHDPLEDEVRQRVRGFIESITGRGGELAGAAR